MDLKLNGHVILFQFSTPRNWWWFPLSYLIRWSEFPKSIRPWNIFGLYHSSHVSVVVGDYVYEAVMWLGVRKISVIEWEKRNKTSISYAYGVDDKTLLKLQFYLEGSIGVPYSYAENVGIFIQRVVKLLFKKDIKNPFKSIERKKKCSELSWDIFRIIKDQKFYMDRDSVGVRYMEELINGD